MTVHTELPERLLERSALDFDLRMVRTMPQRVHDLHACVPPRLAARTGVVPIRPQSRIITLHTHRQRRRPRQRLNDHRINGNRINDNRIDRASFLTTGGPASIATASVATELVTGRTLDEAAAITRQELIEAVGGLPASKIQCSVIAAAAIRNAVAKWRRELPDRSEDAE